MLRGTVSNFPHHMRLLPLTLLILSGIVPFSTAAQDLAWYNDVVLGVNDLVALAVPVLLAVALAVFIWGLMGYFLKAESDSDREESRLRMLWGVIALFVIVSVWGFVVLLMEIVGVEDGYTAEAPNAEFGTGGFGGGGAPGGFPPPPPAI